LSKSSFFIIFSFDLGFYKRYTNYLNFAGNVTTTGGVAPGGAKLVGAAGLGGVTGGTGGITGTTGGTMGAVGELKVTAACGASAAILLMRSDTFGSRAFNALVLAGVIPPAAGSMSSSQAPHWCMEST